MNDMTSWRAAFAEPNSSSMSAPRPGPLKILAAFEVPGQSWIACKPTMSLGIWAACAAKRDNGNAEAVCMHKQHACSVLAGGAMPEFKGVTH